ncbi:MAG: hypothetical protein FWD69_09500 [Polyangiaceae bacterium]|nr:hypothetical protein [Polyangiaceae bacterium]
MKKIGVRILFGFAFLATIYVLYAHLAGVRAARHRESSVGWTTRFSEPAAFVSDFTPDVTPDFHVEPRVGSLFIQRTGRVGVPGEGHAIYRSKPFHFDGGMARLRFRTRQLDDYDVLLGFESADRPDKRLWFVMRNDSQTPSFQLEGTDGMLGPTPAGDSLLQYVDGAEIIRGNDEWHTLGVRFEAASQQLQMFVDDIPVASRVVGWDGGIAARIVFGVRDRKDSEIGVEIGELNWDPQEGREPIRLPNYVDEFVGGRLDPLRWHAYFQQEWRVDGSLRPYETGNGLVLRGRGLQQSAPGVMSPVTICTLPFALTPTRVEVDWDIDTLEHAAIDMTIGNLNRTRWVSVDIANDDKPEPYFVFRGQEDRNIDPTVIDGPPLPDKRTHLLLAYDPWLRSLRVSRDDHEIFSHRFGLQRNEFVRICVGLQVFPEGKAEARLRRFYLHRAPY